MISLLGVEVSRFAARRLVRWMLLLAILGLLFAGGAVWWNSSRDVASASAESRDVMEAELQACKNGEFDLPGQNQPGFDLDAACEELTAEQRSFETVSDPRFHYRDLTEIVLGTSPMVAILALAFGASFVGAEWQRGTMTTALTWEPRRLRLFAAKLAACLVGGYAVAILMDVVLAAAMWPAARFRGTFAGVDSDWVMSLAGTVGRVGVVAAAACLMGCAISMIARHTAAALGVAFVYFGVAEGFIRGLKPAWQPWLLGDNAGRFLVAESSAGPPGRTTVTALLVVALYGALMLGAAATFFARRDVT